MPESDIYLARRRKKTIFFITPFLLSFLTYSYAQILPTQPEVRNFSPLEYDAPAQIWCAVQDKRGIMYFGTGEYILEYDSKKWRKIPFGKGSHVIALAIDSSGRIYAGGQNEFGYLAVDENYSLFYQSLINLVPSISIIGEDTLENTNFMVWKIHPLKNYIFFNAKSHLFLWNGKRITTLHPPEPSTNFEGNYDFYYSYSEENNFFIQQFGRGILQYYPKFKHLINPTLNFGNFGNFQLLEKTEFFKDKIVRAFLPLDDSGNDFFILTEKLGQFIYLKKPNCKLIYIQGNKTQKERKMDLKDSLHVDSTIQYNFNSFFTFSNTEMYYGGIKIKDNSFPKHPFSLNAHTKINLSKYRIWVNTTTSGAFLLDNGKGWTIQQRLTKEDGLQVDDIKYLFTQENNNNLETSQEILWLCTGNGISRVNSPTNVSQYGIESGIAGNGINSICEFNGFLFLATQNGIYYKSIITKMNGEHLFRKIEGINSQCWEFETISLNKDNSKKLIIAADKQGLLELVYNEISKKWTSKQLFTKNVYCISNSRLNLYMRKKDKDNYYFVAGNDGLYYIKYTDFENVKAMIIPMENNVSDILTITSSVTSKKEPNVKDEIWLGTRVNGLIHLKLDSMHQVIHEYHFDEKEGLPAGEIKTFLYQDYPHFFPKTVLIGTSAGLYEIKNYGSNSIIIPCQKFGKIFCNDSIQISQFEQNLNEVLILDGNENLFIIRKDKKNKQIIENYSFSGLKAGEIHSVYPSTESNVYWLGGSTALIKYDKNIIRNLKPKYFAQVRKVVAGYDSLIFNGVFTAQSSDLETNKNKQNNITLFQPDGRVLELDYKLNNLYFEFAAPFFENEEKTLYHYKLIGFDNEWSNWSTDSKAKYTNLPEGKYTFSVIARNIYQHESESGNYQFTIKPPFHRTIWFYSIQFGGIIILFGCAIIFNKVGRGWSDVAAPALATIAMFVVFEYLNNMVENFMENWIGGVILFKIILSGIFTLVIIPIEDIVTRLLHFQEKSLQEKEKKAGLIIVKKEDDINDATKNSPVNEYREEMIKKMLSEGIDEEKIITCTKISKEELQGFKNQE